MTFLQSIAQNFLNRSKRPTNPLLYHKGRADFYQFMFFGSIVLWFLLVLVLGAQQYKAQTYQRETARATERIKLYGMRQGIDPRAVVQRENGEKFAETP